MADAVKEKYGKIRKYIKKFIPILFATAIIFPGFYFQAAAAEEEQGETKSCEAEADNLLNDFDLAAIENFMNEESGNGSFSFTFKELIKELIKGNFSEVFHECLLTLRDSLFGEITKNGKWIGRF